MKKIIMVTVLLISAFVATFASEVVMPTDTVAQNSVEQNKAKSSALDLSNIDLGDVGKLKISGYVQAQWQYSKNESTLMLYEPVKYPLNSDNRFYIRRGRLKFSYEKDFFKAVFQINMTQSGVSAVDAYAAVESNNGVWGGQLGLFDVPFSYEVSYSSSKLESIERSRVMMSLFPGEKDMGAQFNFKYNGFEFKGGLFNGTGIDKENDSRKNFVGKLSYTAKLNSSVELGGILSYYNGGEVNPTDEHYVYKSGQGFQKQTNANFSHSLKQYFGAGAKFLQKDWGIGRSFLMAEAVWGNQPGTLNLNNTVKGGFYPDYGEISLYERDFFGAYAMWVQAIGNSKHSAVLKWDYYDPNTKISGDEIGQLQNTGIADIAYTTLGVGYIFDWTKNLRLTAYYNYVMNETTKYVSGFRSKTDEDVFTIRMQVTF